MRKNPIHRDSNSSPNVSEGCEVTSELSYRGDHHIKYLVHSTHSCRKLILQMTFPLVLPPTPRSLLAEIPHSDPLFTVPPRPSSRRCEHTYRRHQPFKCADGIVTTTTSNYRGTVYEQLFVVDQTSRTVDRTVEPVAITTIGVGTTVYHYGMYRRCLLIRCFATVRLRYVLHPSSGEVVLVCCFAY